MAVEVKKRSEIPEQYKWDLTKMYANDAAWEKALAEFDKELAQIAAFEGTLTESPARLREWMDLTTELDRKISYLFVYASMRRSEDGREEAAQMMFSKVYAKAVDQAGNESAVSQLAVTVTASQPVKTGDAAPLVVYAALLLTAAAALTAMPVLRRRRVR